jgi:hypothetical protein
MQVNNSTNETHCCVSLATNAKLTRHDVTLHTRKLRMLLAILLYFRLLLRCKRDLRCSGMLRSALVVTDVSGQWSNSAILLGLFDPWKLDPTGCPETSVTNYQPTPRNIPEKLKSRFISLFVDVQISHYNKIKNGYPCYHMTALYKLSVTETSNFGEPHRHIHWSKSKWMCL